MENPINPNIEINSARKRVADLESEQVGQLVPPVAKHGRTQDVAPLMGQAEFEALGVSEGLMTEEEETEVEQVVPPQFAGQLGGARPQTKSFASETAAITGESKRSINQHLARADALGDDIDRLAGTSLDKGDVLSFKEETPKSMKDTENSPFTQFIPA